MDARSTFPHAWKSCFIVFIASFLFFYEFALTNVYNALGPYIAQAFNLSPVKLGFTASLFFYTNTIFLIPAGLILDRYSPRLVISIVLLIASSAVLLTTIAHSLALIMISRLLMGFSGGFSLIGCMRVAVNWLPPKYLARAMGFTVALGFLGGLLVQTPLTSLISHIGWRGATVVVAGVGYVIMLLIFLLVRDAPPHDRENVKLRKQKHHETGALRCLKLAFLKKQNWYCGIYTSFMNLPIFMLGALWGIPYLTKVQGLSVTEAATVSGMLYLGTMIGSPLQGFLSDHIGSRTRPMQVNAVLAIILIMVVMLLPHGSYMTFLALFLLLGLITSSQIISYPTVAESNDKMVSSSAISIISMMCMGGGALIQPLFGYLLSYKNGITSSNLMNYSATSYEFAIKALPIAFIIALVLSFLIHDTKGKTIV